MKTFDRILGNVLAVFFLLLIFTAMFYQIMGLMLGDIHTGGQYGNRGNVMMYSDY